MSYVKDLSILGDVTDHVRSERNKLALRIDQRVVQETPFDTTNARSNWLVSDGSSINSPGPIIGAAAAISNGEQAIGKAKVFTELFISNNLPYIQRLNEGWSLQQENPGYIDAIIAQEVARK